MCRCWQRGVGSVTLGSETSRASTPATGVAVGCALVTALTTSVAPVVVHLFAGAADPFWFNTVMMAATDSSGRCRDRHVGRFDHDTSSTGQRREQRRCGAAGRGVR